MSHWTMVGGRPVTDAHRQERGYHEYQQYLKSQTQPEPFDDTDDGPLNPMYDWLDAMKE